MTTEDHTGDSAEAIRETATSHDAVSPSTASLSPGEVACPDCGAIAREPALRHQCTGCGARFDVLRIQPGIRQPEYSPQLLQARRQEPPPAETIEDLSDGEHVRRLLVRRKRGTAVFAMVTPTYLTVILGGVVEYSLYLSRRSTVAPILSVLVLLACGWFIRATMRRISSMRDEVMLDGTGLTHIRRVGRRCIHERHIPLDAIEFLSVGNSFLKSSGKYDPCVVLYHASDQIERRIAGLLGYGYADLEWVARYLATGCALLLDAEPERFLYDVEPLTKARA